MENVMAGERLFEFDVDLCDYVLGNIRQYLHGVTERPKRTGMLRPSERELLDFPRWFARRHSGRFAPLADRIWAGVFGEVERALLSEPELDELAAVLGDMPDRLTHTCTWEPYPALHAQYVECVAEIRAELTRHTAEEWSEASAGFAARLCARPLSLAEGVSVVGDWVRLARQLSRAMGVCMPTAAQQDGRATRPPDETAKQQVAPAKPQPSGTGDAMVCGWQEAMEVTGLKKTKLYELFRDGTLKGYRDGRMIRFYRKGLADYMRERENVTLPPPRSVRRTRAAKSKTTPAMRFRFL
jgi:excisionase family DNA binding protein